MSSYTEKMVARLKTDATEIDLDYDYAVDFAAEFSL